MDYMDGSGPDNNVVPFALARLEKLIQVRLAESLELGEDPLVEVRLSHEADQADIPEISEDPRYYDAVVERIVTTLDEYLDGVEEGAPLTANALNEEVENAFFDAAAQRRACDFFVARLRCQSCGQVVDDESSACETFLRAEPDGSRFGVGSAFDIQPDTVPAEFYAHAMAPATDEPVHVVEGWECPDCQATNWAEVVIDSTEIRSIWSIALTRQVLDRAHFVTSECVDLASQLTGEPAWALLGDDVFEILYDRL